MQTITKCLVLIALCFSVQLINAQDTIPAVKNKKNIEMLEKVKETIIQEEKQYLKEKVEAINNRLEKAEITNTEAQTLKKEAAKIHAQNIENRIAIVDNKIALFKRNDYGISKEKSSEDEFTVSINGEELFSIKPKEDKPKKYDKRTTSDFVLAFGFNNTLIEGENLDNSPYKFGGSRFFEIGWAWKRRVFKNTNFMRFKYGYSFQINGLKPDDNMYFVKQDDVIALEEFPEHLKKSKLSLVNNTQILDLSTIVLFS